MLWTCCVCACVCVHYMCVHIMATVHVCCVCICVCAYVCVIIVDTCTCTCMLCVYVHVYCICCFENVQVCIHIMITHVQCMLQALYRAGESSSLHECGVHKLVTERQLCSLTDLPQLSRVNECCTILRRDRCDTCTCTCMHNDAYYRVLMHVHA